MRVRLLDFGVRGFFLDFAFFANLPPPANMLFSVSPPLRNREPFRGACVPVNCPYACLEDMGTGGICTRIGYLVREGS